MSSRPAPARRSRVRVVGAVAALGLLLPSACSLPWSGPDAEAAAERVARGLARGDLAGVPVVGDRTRVDEQLDGVLAGTSLLGTPAVSVGEVTTDGGTATARLTWRWETGDQDWRYRTTATLVEQPGQEGVEDRWALRWGPAVVEPSLGDGETLAASAVAPERGRILGRGGSVLVEPRPVVRVGIDKQAVRRADAVASARRVAALVDVDPEAFAERVRTAGERAFVEALVLRTNVLGAGLRGQVEALPGGRLVEDELPLAPTREFAAALLGTVGQATAEIVEESDGRVVAGDEVGLSGLQQRYDDRLRGRRGVVVSATGEGEPRQLFGADPVAGRDLETTLDPRLQQLAEDTLTGTGPAAALVALQPSTGAVLGAANGPGSAGLATATVGRYAPGSTYKIVTSLALLRAGVAPGDLVECPATLDVDGREFENYDDYPASGLGRITLEDAVASSCNTAFIGARDRVSPPALAQAAEALGLGVDRDLGFPAYLGQSGSEDADEQTETGAAADLIGQGSVLASPLAMAAVIASVQAGDTVVPRLLPALDPPTADPAEPLTAREAASLRRMLAAVVERGSGSVLAGVPGEPVLAKTGTAEFGDAEPLETHAWMVAAQGDLAVAVFVERGASGSQTAGPLLRDFLRGAGERG